MSIDILTQHEKDSVLIWAVNNVRLPKNIAWDFTDRSWQIEIMDDKSKQIVCRKPTQIGMSTVFLIKMLHFADYHIVRSMLTLPRQDDLYDMVNSRLSEIIDQSPYLQKKMGNIDNVRMKQFGKSWLHFTEMSVPPRMLDVDWMLNDEVDLSNSEYLEQATSRMDASRYGYHHRISTPTIHDYGIDALYKISDMKVWLIKCAYCSFEQELDWDKNVAHEDGQTWYVCSRCHNSIYADDIREGHWVATGNTHSDISGYQISQMMVPYLTPDRMWSQYKTMNRRNFYNFRLGLPYTPTTGGLSRETMIDNCFYSQHDKLIRGFPAETYVLGCDQGDILHVSVGRITQDGNVEIVFLSEISFTDGFDELGKIIKRFNIRRGVIDALPNHHSVTKLIEEFGNRFYRATFNQGLDKLYSSNETEHKVSINKTDAYDNVLYYIANGMLQFYGLPSLMDANVHTAISHLSNMRRDIDQIETRIGGVRTFHVWKNVGPDHYADAILYMLIAADILTGKSTSLEVVDLDKYRLNLYGIEDEMKQFDTGIGFELGKESNLRGEDGGRSDAVGLAPDNPYKLNGKLKSDELLALIRKQG